MNVGTLETREQRARRRQHSSGWRSACITSTGFACWRCCCSFRSTRRASSTSDDPFYVKSGHDSRMPMNLHARLHQRGTCRCCSCWRGPRPLRAAASAAAGHVLGASGSCGWGSRSSSASSCIIPPQTWVGARSTPGTRARSWQYITSGEFLELQRQDGGDYYGGFGIGHLWFILFLLLVSLRRAAAVRLGPGRARRRLPERLLPPPRPPRVVAAGHGPLLWFGEGMPDLIGVGFVYYLVLFVLGYLVVSDDAFVKSAERFHLPALGARRALGRIVVAQRQSPRLAARPVVAAVRAVILGMLASGRCWSGCSAGGGTTSTAVGRSSHLVEGSLPGLHPAPDGDRGGRLLHRRLGGVGAAAVGRAAGRVRGVTFALYEGVRRWSVTRFLFGMRPRSGGPARWARLDRRASSRAKPTPAAHWAPAARSR